MGRTGMLEQVTPRPRNRQRPQRAPRCLSGAAGRRMRSVAPPGLDVSSQLLFATGPHSRCIPGKSASGISPATLTEAVVRPGATVATRAGARGCPRSTRKCMLSNVARRPRGRLWPRSERHVSTPTHGDRGSGEWHSDPMAQWTSSSRPSLACHAATRGPGDGGAPQTCRCCSTLPTSIWVLAMPTWGQSRSKQRERQSAAFSRAIDEGLKANVDAALICGDLFDSNAQSRRAVEHAVAELKRLTDRGVRVVIIPGTHDVYDSRSIYRAFDLRPHGRPARWQRPADGADAGATGTAHQGARPHRLRPRLRHQKAPRSPLDGFERPGPTSAPAGRWVWSTVRARSPARSTGTRSHSPMLRSPPAASTTWRWATGTPTRAVEPATRRGLMRVRLSRWRWTRMGRKRLPGAP